MTSAQVKNHEIQLQIPIAVRFDEHIIKGSRPRTLVLLHGYGENKERIFRKLGQPLSDCAQRLIAVNAPFPAPQLGKDGYKEGYAWYFRSLSLGITMIPPEACESFFDEVIERCQLNNDQVTVIGFSQGGFMLPYLAKKLQTLEQLIGISCGAHPHEFFAKAKPKTNIIHATEDKLMDVATSENQFVDLGLDPKNSRFHRISGGHEIDSAKIELLKRLLG